VDYPGGWAESVTVPADALARIPAGLDYADAAPMGCAGVSVFNAIRRAGIRPAATVAVFGLGGLGHLAVLFAKAMGYRTIAIARGPEREQAAYRLGASHYIDSNEPNPAEILRTLGGADLIVATASSTAAVSKLVGGLRVGGRLTLVGVDGGNLEIPAAHLVMTGQTITGSLTGSARDIEEAMEFAALTGIRPILERIPLADAPAAVARVTNGEARFRVVLEPAGASR
jgi:alcohol dehydrogenase